MTGRLDPHGPLPSQRSIDADSDGWLALLDDLDPSFPLTVDVGQGPVEYDTWGVTAYPRESLGRGEEIGGYIYLYLWLAPRVTQPYICQHGVDNRDRLRTPCPTCGNGPDVPGMVVKYRLAHVRGIGQLGAQRWEPR